MPSSICLRAHRRFANLNVSPVANLNESPRVRGEKSVPRTIKKSVRKVRGMKGGQHVGTPPPVIDKVCANSVNSTTKVNTKRTEKVTSITWKNEDRKFVFTIEETLTIETPQVQYQIETTFVGPRPSNRGSS